ncbi:hypothetical protein [Spirosoma fluviale]|uniref:DnaJ domain-containing protein n=1 Tax=Spirosoma fluviale TaxID=1597977 RepID=A0A286G8K4_9BACT|nr:hypothetical protein [Spirosoma fluviale]SOD91873.1 hypothetical protein SAMN06269250_3683 [Spirosoma fluviale]
MSQPTQHQLVRIGTGSDSLSKSQKEFNRLTQKIEETTAELKQLREASDYIYQRLQANYQPFVDQYIQLRVNLVRLFDRAYEHDDITRAEQKKLADLIRTIASDLIFQYDVDSLEPIYAKYKTSDSDEPDQQLATWTGERSDDSGYDSDSVVAEEAAEDERQRQRASKPKSEKRLAREAKKKADEQNTTKAVRTLYMDLVKAFHPDREPDEAEKVRKTEIMHRVIAAYEKSDLLALFRLQLEFERIDQAHLESLAESQLNYYNKILRQQAQELDDELAGLQKQLARMTGKSKFTAGSLVGFDISLNSDIGQLKRDTKQLKNDLKALADLGVLKQWLKSYR